MDKQRNDGPHVVYIITKLELGGAQKVCLALFKDTLASGMTATLITGNGGILRSAAEKIGSVHTIPELDRKISFKDVTAFFKLVSFLKEQKKQHPYCIVHTHSSKAGLLGRWAAWWAGCSRIVHTVHGYPFHPYQNRFVRSFYQVLEGMTCFITSKIVCVSEKDKKLGEQLFSGFGSKSVLIRAAVDETTFTAKKQYYPARAANHIVIGSIGCFKPQKNLQDLIDAFALVLGELDSRVSVSLEIVGDGILRRQLEAHAKRCGILENITFLGWQDNVALCMQRWDVFAMSSLWEGLPCAVIEARLSKLPVVAYDVGGIAEVIVHGENGLLVKPGDIAGLAQNLLTLICRSDLRGLYGRHTSKKLFEFTYAAMAAGHQKLYKSLLK